MVTQKELLPGQLLSNVQLVSRYRQADPSDVTRARMHIFHLLANGDLSFDPRHAPISDQTLIYPGGVITMGRIRLGVGTEWLLDGRA